jgi:uncharacterized membrane protein (DUF106 family)
VLNPIIGFDHKFPALTILLAAIIMVGLSTGVRHLFIDWIHMARIQSVMRAYQKSLREARAKRDTKRIEELQKAQPKLMGLQAELSGAQMKPMTFTFLIIIPLFAWLSQYVEGITYPFFAAPWNTHIDMFGSNGIIFGTSVLPHWILFYTAISIPFGALVQKALKFFSWREKWHLTHPNVHPEAAGGSGSEDSE